mmetsp:Transcript_21958/g.61396  ORF Transcript_21958/g.61396 Transcript_21958/m.61396 type:complete len:203 (-) Transcript_21958:634-1242(-)
MLELQRGVKYPGSLRHGRGRNQVCAASPFHCSDAEPRDVARRGDLQAVLRRFVSRHCAAILKEHVRGLRIHVQDNFPCAQYGAHFSLLPAVRRTGYVNDIVDRMRPVLRRGAPDLPRPSGVPLDANTGLGSRPALHLPPAGASGRKRHETEFHPCLQARQRYQPHECLSGSATGRAESVGGGRVPFYERRKVFRGRRYECLH